MMDQYPPSDVVQSLIDLGFIKKIKEQRLPNNRINYIYRVCDEYVIFISLKGLETSTRIDEISETYSKLNVITQNVLTYEQSLVFPNISIVMDNLAIYNTLEVSMSERHKPFTNLVKKLVRRRILMYKYEFHTNNTVDIVYGINGDNVIIYNPLGSYIPSTRISEISEVFTKDGQFISYNLLTYESKNYLYDVSPNIYLAVYEQLSTDIFNQKPEYRRKYVNN